ncbi:MAG: hypothetical protein IJX67_07165 [Oscillospiraceae bacterium]|nr:hypothetical protein [Clostridia bacterium]MBQ9168169.1 hypothetical protein [Oscillospiraceae bacterium]
MDAKAGIKELMDERGWTIYELSKRPAWHRQPFQTCRNAIQNQRFLLCALSAMVLHHAGAVFAEGNMAELSPEQKAFFARWTALSTEHKEMLMNLVSSMI